MQNLRIYGNAPFDTAVIHGGPGAAGEMAPVARELASGGGVLEPLQTAATLEGQVEQLKTVLKQNANLAVTLIGFSWGAWLSFILAANYPAIVKKLILVGSGPFEKHYADRIQQIRLSRLNEEDKIEFKSIIRVLNDPETEDKDMSLAKLGMLVSKTDEYDPIKNESIGSNLINCNGDIFQKVWKDAAQLRKNGKLLTLGKHIRCPVTAIHGDWDPHPAEGVQKPLSAILEDFRFILLERCGHKPWIERQAKDSFYKILKEELQ